MPDDVLLIPGPTNLSTRVREVLARPQLGHNSPKFVEALKDLLGLMKFAFKASNGHPIVVTGSGSLAMESVVVSLVEPEDRVLVVDTGAFGKRFAQMLELNGAKVDVVSFSMGKHAEPKMVEEKFSQGTYKAVFVTHVDTSTTVANPIAEIVASAEKHGVLSVVDSVCGIGGCEFDFDRLGCDIALTAPQKALAAPPGVALVVLSDDALNVMKTRRSQIRSYYMNLVSWKRIMDDPTDYLATPATQIQIALREALLEVREEGLERRWYRHHVIAEGIRAAFENLGLGFVAEEGYRADTVTGVYVPQSRAREAQRRLREDFHIQVSLGFGDIKESALRIGHFGNITPSDALAAVSAFESALRGMNGGSSYGAAAEAALPHLEKLMGPEGKT